MLSLVPGSQNNVLSHPCLIVSIGDRIQKEVIRSDDAIDLLIVSKGEEKEAFIERYNASLKNTSCWMRANDLNRCTKMALKSLKERLGRKIDVKKLGEGKFQIIDVLTGKSCMLPWYTQDQLGIPEFVYLQCFYVITLFILESKN